MVPLQLVQVGIIDNMPKLCQKMTRRARHGSKKHTRKGKLNTKAKLYIVILCEAFVNWASGPIFWVDK